MHYYVIHSKFAKHCHAFIDYEEELVKVFSDAEDLFDNVHRAAVADASAKYSVSGSTCSE